MPKLAIYIPKRRMKELERWRKRINFSQVFMQALAREIRELSREPETDEERLSAAARHYKRQLTENFQSLVDIGFRLGSGQVTDCRLSVEVIERLLAVSDPDALTDDDRCAVEAALADSEVAELAAEQGYDDHTQPAWRSFVYGGYVRGVAAAWQRVCEKMRTV